MADSAFITYETDTGEWLLHNSVEVAGVFIPEGFTFDLASIPRFLWPLVGPFELSIEAPLVHDYLYRRGGLGYYTRRQADRIFREVMKEEGIAAWRRWPAWLAVRLFGFTGWREVE